MFEQWLDPARAQLQRLPAALCAFSATAPIETTRPADTWLGLSLSNVAASRCLAMGLLALLVVFHYVQSENSELVRYKVPSLRAPSKREMLVNPTVKVR